MAAEILHKDARKLLSKIHSAAKTKQKLTYNEAAEFLNRFPPQNNAKTLGNTCDLLDAAACYANVPLLAFFWVRNYKLEINPEAWKELEDPLRNAIIKRSEKHPFSDADIEAIRIALDELAPRGNTASWDHVKAKFPGEKLYQRLLGYSVETDAIDDLGTDTAGRTWMGGFAYARDQRVRNAVLRRAQGKCEYCGKLGFLKTDGTRYLETHHIIALANDGADRPTNVIAVCPNDHREAHFAHNRIERENQMIERVKAIIDRGLKASVH